MTDLTPEKIAELEALDAKRRPGPWEYRQITHYGEEVIRDEVRAPAAPRAGEPPAFVCIVEDTYWHDAAFIAAAANALPALLADWRRMREALEEAEDVLALVEIPSFKDPDYGAEVEELGERIGFGALMSSASASWRAKIAKEGMQGGEFVAGPCRSTVVNVIAKIRAALGGRKRVRRAASLLRELEQNPEETK